mgnify:CR=1 FL=1
MKPTTKQFEYDGARLEAIRICLADKQTDLNHELEAFMDSTYKKYVPAPVRDFIEKKEEMTPADEPKTSRRNVSQRRAVLGDKSVDGTDTRDEE